MELLESDDMKSELLRKSAKHREALEDEVKDISARTEKIVTNALIIGGALALTYFLVREFSGSKKKTKTKVKTKAKKAQVATVSEGDDNEEEEEGTVSTGNNMMAQIGTALASQATAILLSIAKEKLAAYLEAQSEKKNKPE